MLCERVEFGLISNRMQSNLTRSFLGRARGRREVFGPQLQGLHKATGMQLTAETGVND